LAVALLGPVVHLDILPHGWLCSMYTLSIFKSHSCILTDAAQVLMEATGEPEQVNLT